MRHVLKLVLPAMVSIVTPVLSLVLPPGIPANVNDADTTPVSASFTFAGMPAREREQVTQLLRLNPTTAARDSNDPPVIPGCLVSVVDPYTQKLQASAETTAVEDGGGQWRDGKWCRGGEWFHGGCCGHRADTVNVNGHVMARWQFGCPCGEESSAPDGYITCVESCPRICTSGFCRKGLVLNIEGFCARREMIAESAALRYP